MTFTSCDPSPNQVMLPSNILQVGFQGNKAAKRQDQVRLMFLS